MNDKKAKVRICKAIATRLDPISDHDKLMVADWHYAKKFWSHQYSTAGGEEWIPVDFFTDYACCIQVADELKKELRMTINAIHDEYEIVIIKKRHDKQFSVTLGGSDLRYVIMHVACVHWDIDWLDPMCYECGMKMIQKVNNFWKCPNCNVDFEKDFDKAISRGFELGYDIVDVINRGAKNESER